MTKKSVNSEKNKKEKIYSIIIEIRITSIFYSSNKHLTVLYIL